MAHTKKNFIHKLNGHLMVTCWKGGGQHCWFEAIQIFEYYKTQGSIKKAIAAAIKTAVILCDDGY